MRVDSTSFDADAPRRTGVAVLTAGLLALSGLTLACSTGPDWDPEVQEIPRESPMGARETAPETSQAVLADLTTPPMVPPLDVEIAPTDRYHVIAKGDTLMSLARKYYGDASRWRGILEANRDSIDDPNLIFQGQRLVIPY